MKVLLVGGAGLIGSALEKILFESGHDTLVLDNFTCNVVEQKEVHGQVITGNASSYATMSRVFSFFKPDIVLHFAVSMYDKENMYDAFLESDTVVATANNIIRCASVYKPKYVFFGSSGEVYKGGSKKPVSEKSRVGNFSYSGASNLYVESMFHLASRQCGFVFTSIRYFQVYGERKFLSPKQDVLTFFVDCINKGLDLVIVGPNTYIDILSLTEAVKASYLIVNSVINGEKLNIVNVGSGEGVGLDCLYKMLCSSLNGDYRAFKVPPRSQIRSLVADNSKLMSLGWKPVLNLENNVYSFISKLEAPINA